MYILYFLSAVYWEIRLWLMPVKLCTCMTESGISVRILNSDDAETLQAPATYRKIIQSSSVYKRTTCIWKWHMVFRLVFLQVDLEI